MSGAEGKRQRGRPAKSDEEAKRYPLSIRTTKEMRDSLEAAANASGRSVAQEVELRLEALGIMERVTGSSRETVLLANAIQATINMIELQTGAAWHNTPLVYGAVKTAIERLVWENRPRVRREGFYEVILPLDERRSATSLAAIDAQKALVAFDAAHPEVCPGALRVDLSSPPTRRGFLGTPRFGLGPVDPLSLLGSISPEVPEVSPDLIERRKALQEELDRALAAADAARQAYTDALQPFEEEREAMAKMGDAAAATVAPAYRIIPS